jgi:hypothetical protein
VKKSLAVIAHYRGKASHKEFVIAGLCGIVFVTRRDRDEVLAVVFFRQVFLFRKDALWRDVLRRRCGFTAEVTSLAFGFGHFTPPVFIWQ